LIFPPHEDNFHLGGNNNQIPPKATLNAEWIRVVPNKKFTVYPGLIKVYSSFKIDIYEAV